MLSEPKNDEFAKWVFPYQETLKLAMKDKKISSAHIEDVSMKESKLQYCSKRSVENFLYYKKGTKPKGFKREIAKSVSFILELPFDLLFASWEPSGEEETANLEKYAVYLKNKRTGFIIDDNAKNSPASLSLNQKPLTRALTLEFEDAGISGYPPNEEIIRQAQKIFSELGPSLKLNKISLALAQISMETARSAAVQNEQKALLQEILNNPDCDLPKYIPVQVLIALSMSFEMRTSDLVAEGSKEADILLKIEEKHQCSKSILSRLKSRFSNMLRRT